MKRRRFLSLVSGLGTAHVVNSPLALLTNGILGGLFYDSSARAAGMQSKRLFSLFEQGGPPRWCNNLFLDPYGDGGLIRNKGVGNRYVEENGRYTDVEYATVKKKGINVNWIWNFPVPKAGGGTRPFDELLDYGLFMNGIDVKDVRHEAAARLHFRSAGTDQSILALPADYGQAPIASVMHGFPNSYGYFSSLTNKSAMMIPFNVNAIAGLMKPFSNIASDDMRSAQMATSELFDQALLALDARRNAGDPRTEAIGLERRAIMELFRDGVSDLEKEWGDLVAKYKDLIDRAMHTEIPGLNDKPIGVELSKRDIRYRYHTDSFVDLDDLRDMITERTTVFNLAEVFAVAEYAFRKGLTRSFGGVVRGVQYVKTKKVNSTGMAYLGHDMHYWGAMLTTLLNSFFARAYSACLLEFIDVMKGAGIWHDMVIDAAGEFGRTPVKDGGGSNHGPGAQNVALYSGAFKGPLVIGNMMREGGHVYYPGSWGRGAPVETLGTPIGGAHFHATLAHLLGVPSPVTSANPLVALKPDGTLIKLIERSKLV